MLFFRTFKSLALAAAMIIASCPEAVTTKTFWALVWIRADSHQVGQPPRPARGARPGSRLRPAGRAPTRPVSRRQTRAGSPPPAAADAARAGCGQRGCERFLPRDASNSLLSFRIWSHPQRVELPDGRKQSCYDDRWGALNLGKYERVGWPTGDADSMPTGVLIIVGIHDLLQYPDSRQHGGRGRAIGTTLRSSVAVSVPSPTRRIQSAACAMESNRSSGATSSGSPCPAPTRIVQHPARRPASTSRHRSPTMKLPASSIPRSRAADVSSPGAGLRQEQRSQSSW